MCRWISGLHVAPEAFPEELCLYGTCDWTDPPEARPGELTDGMVIGCGDGLRLGPGWWYDAYFDWYYVYEPDLVARSLSGDHSWVAAFLRTGPSRGAEPRAAPDRRVEWGPPDAKLSRRPPGEPYVGGGGKAAIR